MLLIFYVLLILRVARCTEDQIFETKTIRVGDDVNLTCTRKSLGHIFWIRIVSGNVPKILAKTYSFETDPRITASEEPGTFVLHITKAELSDTAVYYCLKTQQQSILFIKGIDLRVEALEPIITTVLPSDPVRPGDSVTLQCSVLSNSENKPRPEENSVCCFKAGSHEYRPSFNYSQRNKFGEYEENSVGFSAKKCMFSFSRNVSYSNDGTYYCAVATCEEIMSVNRSKLNSEAVSVWDSQRNNTILFLLCVALAISLIVIAFLISFINTWDFCSGTATGGQQNQHLRRNEDIWLYSSVVFTMMKTGSGGTTGAKAAERKRIYDAVKSFGLD